jgi:hypothetical protein
VLPMALSRGAIPESYASLYVDGVACLRSSRVSFQNAQLRDALLRRLT